MGEFVSVSMAISRTAVLVAVLAFGAICVVHADKSHVEIKHAVKQAEAPAEEEHLPPLFPLGPKMMGILCAALGLIVPPVAESVEVASWCLCSSWCVASLPSLPSLSPT